MRFSLRTLFLAVFVSGAVVALIVRDAQQSERIRDLELSVRGMQRMLEANIQENGTPFSSMNYCVQIGVGSAAAAAQPYCIVGGPALYKTLTYGQVDILKLRADVDELQKAAK